MFMWIRRRVTYANVAMTLALVFAMAGGAYAAHSKHGKRKSKVIITSTSQISKPVLEALKGKVGLPGAEGKVGPSGPEGKTGLAGASGKDGAPGAPGESVAASQFSGAAGSCAEGGSKFVVAGTETYACNGSPWTAGGTLPAGKTETGSWTAVASAQAHEEFIAGSISFTIPLKTAPTPHYLKPSESTPECPGTTEAPTATAGNLCVYASLEVNTNTPVIASTGNGSVAPNAAGTTGAMVLRQSAGAGPSLVFGTWAVTEAGA